MRTKAVENFHLSAIKGLQHILKTEWYNQEQDTKLEWIYDRSVGEYLMHINNHIKRLVT